MVPKEIYYDPGTTCKSKMNLSFSGCGFLGFYHVGVASCIREYAPQLVQEKIAGASAGALAACALITGACLGECTTYVIRIATQARARALGPLHPGFKLVKYLRDGLHEFLPDDAHISSSGRLHISLTRVSDRRNVIVNQFDTKDDLIQALICSAFIPFYCGIVPPKYKGVRYIDGGLSDNIPILDSHTVTVSPLAGECDICPRDDSANFLHITLANMSIQFTASNVSRLGMAFFPPHPEYLMKLTRFGFDDALRFLQKNNLITCTRHFMRIESSITTVGPLTVADIDGTTSDDDSASQSSDSGCTVTMPTHSASMTSLHGAGTSGSHYHDPSTCEDCKRREHIALLDSLPPSVVTAIQGACDSVNNGLFVPLYNLRAFKVISLLTAPWILPLDVTIVLCQRLFEWAPYMPGDMQWFFTELSVLVKEMLNYFQQNRHKYSARLSCQMDLTSVYGEDLSLLIDPETGHSYHQYKHRHGSGGDRISLGSNKLHAANEATSTSSVEFHVDFKSSHRSPRQCVSELRQHLGNKMDIQVDSAESESTYDVSLEQMESCLQAANYMDSSLAFFYVDEKNKNTVKVSELYVYDERDVLHEDGDDFTWDDNLSLKSEADHPQSGSLSPENAGSRSLDEFDIDDFMNSGRDRLLEAL